MKEDLMLHQLNFDENGLNMALSGDSAKLFLMALVNLFEQNGGENFLTMEVSNNQKKYEITIVNQNGNDTPSEKIGRLESKLKEMETYIRNGIELGYIDDREEDYKKFLES